MEHTMEQNKQRVIRHRTRTRVGQDGRGRADRVACRNRVLVARWYYWTECKRLRSDDALKKLCEEFFIEERTVANAILQGDAYFRELLTRETTCKMLSKEFSAYNWQ